ncbi:MAG: hypothetical protein Q8O13_00820 [Candidatus Omnitrophota bacterium]|nr:hypothetical protein [Candidatus Omnitrophota bacterium]
MNNLNIEVYSEVFTHTILTEIPTLLTTLGGSSIFKDLNENEWNIMMKEFLLFEIHLCDRLFFLWYGDEFRNKLFDKIVTEIAFVLDKMWLKHEITLENKLNKITMESFADYLKEIRADVLTFDWFISEYNQRTNEYVKYKFERPGEDESWEGWLFWEFGKRVASLLGRDSNAIIIVSLQRSALSFMKLIGSAKELIDKKLENNLLN